MPERRSERWLRPRYILPLLALAVLATVVFSPSGELGAGSARLTTHSPGPFGARGIYETVSRLGWRVERRSAPFRAPVSDDSTYLVLQPPMSLSATEVSALLDAVRAGANAIVVPASGTPLADSLGVGQSPMSVYRLEILSGSDAPRAADRASAAVARSAIALGTFSRSLRPVPRNESDTAPSFPANTTTLVSVRRGDRIRPAVMALRLGRGRVIALADPDFMSNIAVRNHHAAIFTVRILEWLDPARQRPLVFDEYHQGFGTYQSMPSTVRHALVSTPPGRVLLQLVVAGLLLLLVYGVRPIAPAPRRSIERRSPLEHVGALARAYEQMAATRLATKRLVRGLRRRHPLGATGALDDDGYLSLVSSRKAELASDVDILRASLARPLPANEWVAVGRAIDHIERTITQ
jgi:hypothetical protein